ncbi:WG repeat-containing protein [bacterium]|nr:WG repeat-containing protein [bacterium]
MPRARRHLLWPLLALLAGCGRCGETADPEALLPVRLSGREGYATPAGEIRLDFAWDEARRFAEGLAVVGTGPVETRRYGAIDAAGRVVIPLVHPELGDFREGRARFRSDTPAGPRYGFLDAEGRVAIAARFQSAGDFSEGLAAASEGEPGRRGYIDPRGEFAIELPRLPDFSGEFHGGLAVVVFNPLDHRVIDRKGRERFASSQRLGARVAENCIESYSNARDRYRYVRPDGREAFPGEFAYARAFSGGRALVKPADAALFGFIDPTGALVVPARLRQAGDFDAHPTPLAPALPEDAARWGYIDAAGGLAIAPRFVWAGPFRGDWAPVETEIGPNYVSREGRLLWEPERRAPADWERNRLATLAGRPLLRLDLAAARGATAADADSVAVLDAGALLGISAGAEAALATARLRPGGEFLLEGENRRLLFALAPGSAPPPADAFRGEGLVPGWRVSLVEDDPFLAAAPAAAADSLRLAGADRALLGALLLAHRELPPRKVLALYRALPSRLVDLGGGQLRRYPLLLDAARLPAAEIAEALGPLPLQDDSGAWRLLALSGEYASETRFETLGALREGRRPFRRGGRWGYLDAAGREQSPPRWAWAEAFSEGLAAVSPDSQRIGFIDPAGTLVIAPLYRGVDAFHEGRCMAVVDSLGGYIDRRGNWVVTPRFAWSGAFAEGLAPASLDGRAVGFIDSTGTFAIAPRFQYAGEFREGLAPVTEGGRVGFVDRRGRLVIPCRYEEGMAFSEGLAAVQVEGLIGYVDRAGQARIAPRYAAGTPFAHGVALVIEDERLLIIDAAGRALWRSAP